MGEKKENLCVCVCCHDTFFGWCAWMGGKTKGEEEWEIDLKIDGLIRMIDRQTDRWTDGQLASQTDRKID